MYPCCLANLSAAEKDDKPDVTESADTTALKSELHAELSRSNTDLSRVLELASALARTDPEYVRFTVDASHVSRLGLELVAKQETAVAELVKNGYDADAKVVDVTFHNVDRRGGSLEVWDNGNGMDRDQIISGFMRLSTPDKVENPTSPRFKRNKAGRKGIGRFAAQRLGTKLTLVTQPIDVDYAWRLVIDWQKFTARADLALVTNRIERVAKLLRHGTSLLIDDLRDAWTLDNIQRAFSYVSELIQPFPLSPVLSQSDADPGFKVTFSRERRDDLEIVADEWTSYFKHALAVVNATVDNSGRGQYSLNSRRYRVSDTGVEISADRDFPARAFSAIRDVHLRVHYYLDDDIPKQVRASVTKKLREAGGVRIYRNGFRVLPYGEQFDDWLGLDASMKARSILPPHGNRNVLGFVEIRDPDGKRFQEVASREGLVENAAFKELREFCFRVVTNVAIRVAESRGKKARASDKRKETPGATAAALAARMRAGDLPSAEEIIALGDLGEAILRELGVMRVLASLGLTIGEFTHEVDLGFTALEADLLTLSELAGLSAEASETLRRISRQVASLRSYVEYFEETVRDAAQRQMRPLEVREVIENFRHLVQPRIDRQQLDITVDIEGYALFTRAMHPAELTSVLINLFTNSVKAIRAAAVHGRIAITVVRDLDDIIIDVADNGIGIRPENVDRVFDAFFTTTGAASPAASDAEHLRGMGLGLTIVKDIVEAYGGSVTVVPPPADMRTCFRIQIPAADDSEVNASAY